MGARRHCYLAAVLICPKLGCVCWAGAASSASPLEEELCPLLIDLEELNKRHFRPGRSGYSSRLRGQAPFKGSESGFPYSDEMLELVNYQI